MHIDHPSKAFVVEITLTLATKPVKPRLVEARVITTQTRSNGYPKLVADLARA
jgi:hypothetical protein